MLLLRDVEKSAEVLSTLCIHHGFDGWQLHFEAMVPPMMMNVSRDQLVINEEC